MNLSPTMFAALRFFLCNLTGDTHITKAPAQRTIDALTARNLLTTDDDNILIPNAEGMKQLGIEPSPVTSETLSIGQISDDEWSVISPALYAQIKAGEQAAEEEARHSSRDSGIQSQGCEEAEINTVLGSGLRHPCRNDGVKNELGFFADAPMIGSAAAMRKVCADLTASYQGELYYFPDAEVGQWVSFLGGQPQSATAVKVHRDLLGFYELPLDIAASKHPSHTLHHTTHKQNKTVHLGSLNKWHNRVLAVAKTVRARVLARRNVHTVHTNDDGAGHGQTMNHQGEVSMLAFDVDSVDRHKHTVLSG